MDTEGRTVQLTHHVVIDNQQFTISLFAPTRALKLLARLTKLAGEGMAVMAKAGGKDADPLQLLPEAVKIILSRLDEDEFVGLVKELMASVTVDKKLINFDIAFQGRLGLLMKLLAKVIEVQFLDFYTALGESVQGVKEELVTG